MIVNNKDKIKHTENNMVKKQLRTFKIKIYIKAIKIKQQKIKIQKIN